MPHGGLSGSGSRGATSADEASSRGGSLANPATCGSNPRFESVGVLTVGSEFKRRRSEKAKLSCQLSVVSCPWFFVRGQLFSSSSSGRLVSHEQQTTDHGQLT